MLTQYAQNAVSGVYSRGHRSTCFGVSPLKMDNSISDSEGIDQSQLYLSWSSDGEIR